MSEPTAKAGMELEAAERIRARSSWIEKINALVDQVEAWAKELNWATRRVEKKLDDSFIGEHQVPALLMQEDTCRVSWNPFFANKLTVGSAPLVQDENEVEITGDDLVF